ncbi:MAG: N-acetyl-gamma-glutamyl-phosphate reductase [Flavobacteriaceae bacterium]|nr:MAG: N-acetyl-gamma-glutamyl-phosphate reductase [Flavobacteriaceae bacterium]
MIQVGIIGGAGYTAGELIRLLVHHKHVNIDFVYSTSNAGNKIYDVHQDLMGEIESSFTGLVNLNVDVVFLCLGHGNSTTFLNKHDFATTTKIIDLSNDFRLLKDHKLGERAFVYGLPELQKEAIGNASNIANPGCFATAIQLGLLPLAKAQKLNSTIHVNATTGATGAGVSPGSTTHFSWRSTNFSVYKAFSHQHLDEISESLQYLQNKEIIQKNTTDDILFIPNRGSFSRGIFASIYLESNLTESAAYQLFKDFYKEAVYTHVSEKELHLKQVVNTNNCFIHVEKHGKQLLITTVIDNLLKGASGQAIQNMNLMFGWDQKEGLRLKASSF